MSSSESTVTQSHFSNIMQRFQRGNANSDEVGRSSKKNNGGFSNNALGKRVNRSEAESNFSVSQRNSMFLSEDDKKNFHALLDNLNYFISNNDFDDQTKKELKDIKEKINSMEKSKDPRLVDFVNNSSDLINEKYDLYGVEFYYPDVAGPALKEIYKNFEKKIMQTSWLTQDDTKDLARILLERRESGKSKVESESEGNDHLFTTIPGRDINLSNTKENEMKAEKESVKNIHLPPEIVNNNKTSTIQSISSSKKEIFQSIIIEYYYENTKSPKPAYLQNNNINGEIKKLFEYLNDRERSFVDYKKLIKDMPINMQKLFLDAYHSLDPRAVKNRLVRRENYNKILNNTQAYVENYMEFMKGGSFSETIIKSHGSEEGKFLISKLLKFNDTLGKVDKNSLHEFLSRFLLKNDTLYNEVDLFLGEGDGSKGFYERNIKEKNKLKKLIKISPIAHTREAGKLFFSKKINKSIVESERYIIKSMYEGIRKIESNDNLYHNMINFPLEWYKILSKDAKFKEELENINPIILNYRSEGLNGNESKIEIENQIMFYRILEKMISTKF